METRRRNSLRLKGYDYSQPGEFFVTICTADRRCILGEVVTGKMRLSESGKIVESCWLKIPEHFPNTNVDAFQIMPNHVHGIIITKNHPGGAQHAAPPQGKHMGRRAKPAPGSLSTIVRSFKSAATKQVHERGLTRDPIWQRGFYERIIWDDVGHFFVEQYIELNPVIWELDADNPSVRVTPGDSMKSMLVKRFGLKGQALRRVLDLDQEYGRWSGSSFSR